MKPTGDVNVFVLVNKGSGEQLQKKQRVEPFRISLLFRFRFKTFQKFGFRFGSGSVAPKFKGLGLVQVQKFEILKVRVRFRFNDLKFKRFRFGSPKKSVFSPVRGLGSGSVRLSVSLPSWHDLS